MSKIIKKTDLTENIQKMSKKDHDKWVDRMRKKKKKKKEPLDELVDDKGGKIQGDEHIDQSNKASSSVDTTDDHVRKTRQGTPFFRKYSMGESDKSLEEESKDKMKKMLEDILSTKNYDKDVIDKVKLTNGVPDMDVLKEKHPVLVRKIAHIKTLLDREEVSGEDKAVLLNSLLSTNLVDIPSVYKKELSRKLGY